MMRSWRSRAIAAAGMSLMAFWLLQIPERERPHWSEREWQDYPEIVAAIRISRPLGLRAEAYRLRLERVEARVLIRQVPASRGLVVVAGAGVPAPARALVEATARAELAGLGLETPKHPIVVRVDVDTTRSHSATATRITVFPRAKDDPCGVIVRVKKDFPRDFLIKRVLGPCEFVAAFGAPGEGIRRWMGETRMYVAGSLKEPSGAWAPGDSIGFAKVSGNEWPYQGCRAGVADACERVFSPRRDPSEGYPPGYLPEYWDALWENGDVSIDNSGLFSSFEARPVTVGLLGALADDLDERRFAAIWTSDLPPAEAFERVEARPISEWVSERLAKYMPPYRRGPGPGRLQLALAIILSGLAFGLATKFSARRMS